VELLSQNSLEDEGFVNKRFLDYLGLQRGTNSQLVCSGGEGGGGTSGVVGRWWCVCSQMPLRRDVVGLDVLLFLDYFSALTPFF